MKQTQRHPYLVSAEETAAALLGRADALKEVADDLAARNAPYLEGRLKSMANQWGALDSDHNQKRLAAAISSFAHDETGSLISFHDFKALIEDELAGLVVTAHPTFSLSAEARAFAETYAKRYFNGESKDTNLNLPTVERIHAEKSPTLYEELDQANGALLNMRRALRILHKTVFQCAAHYYPNEYRSLRPRLATIASWVGFDLDGRTDIDWSLGLLFRYHTAVSGLTECLGVLKSTEVTNVSVEPYLKVIEAGIETLLACFEKGKTALVRYQEGQETLADFNRLAVDNQTVKDEAREKINTALEQLLAADLDESDWAKAALFATEWHSVGIGLSHIHFRLNAAQLHNAMGPEINLTKAPDQSAMRRHYLAAISEKLNTVKPQSVHYGILAGERTTARRVFMMAAQFRKHFDAATRIRMLVAESDTPFTMLAALYYARLFGVDDYVEISPLFETAVGLERGDRVIAELIENPHFLAYIRQQGRFCVQLGFSDSGRYIGQPAASLAIERFKLRLILLWKARGLGDIQLLFFDTHGESIGRGAVPGSLKRRFLYTQPPRVRQFLSMLKRPDKHEVSFQGGEGFLWFMTEASALATLTDFLEVRLGTHSAEGDQLYDEKGWALDFFLTLVEYQTDLTEMKGYVRLIDSVGQRLLYPTGSRSTKRQGSGALSQRLERISQIRAIPNNAILQQLGFMANSCAGFGLAIDRSPEKFFSVYGQSDRLQMVSTMAAEALARSDIGVLEAYAEMLSPAYWLDLLDSVTDTGRRAHLRRLSRLMENLFDYDSIAVCVRKLRRDAGSLKDNLAEFSASGLVPPSMSEDLRVLHKMRLGLIQYIYIKAMEIPRFSSRFDISLEELLVDLLHLEVKPTMERLRAIFPVSVEDELQEDFGEPATYVRGDTSGYSRLHRSVFDPIEGAYELLQTISGLIALKVGAYG